MKTKLSPCKVVPAGDPNPRTHATYKREVQALLQATYNYTPAEAEYATSPADWGQLVRTAWASGKAPCWSADHIARFDGRPLRGGKGAKRVKFARNVSGARGRDPRRVTRKQARDSELERGCFRSTVTNFHTHTVCPKRNGLYTTSSDFGHTHTVNVKMGRVVTSSSDFFHTHDFDFSKKMGRSPQRGRVCPIGTKIQTLIFDTRVFDIREAKKWVKKHGFKSGKTELKPNYIQVRQEMPTNFGALSFRVIDLGHHGVSAIIGCPK